MRPCPAVAALAAFALAAHAGCRAYDRDAYAAAVDAAAGDAATCDASSASNDYCASIPALAAAPAIDGELECGLALFPITTNGWTRRDALPPGDISASYAAAWRPDGLYVFIRVETPRVQPPFENEFVWCGDGVEFYVDADGAYAMPPRQDAPGGGHFAIAAPAGLIGRRGGVEANTFGGYAPWTSTRFVSVARAWGYDTEAFIAASDLGLMDWRPAAGGRIGFDVSINVSTAGAATPDYCTHHYGQYSLRVGMPTAECSGIPSCTTEAYCAVALRP